VSRKVRRMVRARIRQIRQRVAASVSAQSVGEPGTGKRAWPGWFIAIEGGDGTGKSTQVTALAEWLERRGFEVVATREPGGTELGRQLRDILLHRNDLGGIGDRTEALLFAADRADHIEKVVRPALARGAIVISDRHVDSSIAYQSGGRGLPADAVIALSAFATNRVRPDLTVLLDLEPADARERAALRAGRAGGPDRLEAEPPAFHTRVRAVFRDRAAADPGHYLVVDAAEPPAVITAICQDRLAALLPQSPRETAEEAERRRALAEAEEAERARWAAQAAAAQAAAEKAAREAEAREQAEAEAREAVRRAESAAAAERAAAERAAAEAARIEAQRQADADRAAQELQAGERARQLAADAARRTEAEMVVRQAEARAKAQARDQAAADLAARAESEARTRQLVAQAAASRSGSPASPSDSASNNAPVSASTAPTPTSTHSSVASSPSSSPDEPAGGSGRKSGSTLADDLLGDGMDEPGPKSRRWRSKDGT
jgi:dTMP kinase